MAVRYPLHLLFLPCQLILSKDTIWNQFLPYLFSISELPDQICSGLKPKQGFCAECSAWHLKLKLCSSCRARHCVSSHGAGTSPSLAILLEVQAVEKIIKKFSLWSTQILLSENWICRICIHPNFFLLQGVNSNVYGDASGLCRCCRGERGTMGIGKALKAAVGGTTASFNWCCPSV